MTADDDDTINRMLSTFAYPLAGSAYTVESAVESALAPEPESEPERYVRAWVYELSLKIIHDLRKELGQDVVEVRRRGRVSVDEINEEIEEAKDRLEMAYRRRARYFIREDERFLEREKTT